MFHLGAAEFEFLGRTVTFDVVTVYGLVCAGVFLTGFVIANRYERQRAK